MRQLILTALATEHDLSNGGAEQYFLVFNNGELRLPVPQETAEAVIQALYGGGDATPEAEHTTARPKPPEQSGIVMAPVGSTYSETDDGVDQV